MKETTKSIIYGATPIALYIIQTSSTEYVQKFQHALTLLYTGSELFYCYFFFHYLKYLNCDMFYSYVCDGNQE